MNLSSHLIPGAKNTLRVINGTNFAFKGNWKQVYENTIVDQFHVGDFSSAIYTITVEFDSNKKEAMQVMACARPDQATITVFCKAGIDDALIQLSASVNDSIFSLIANPASTNLAGSKLTYHVNYTETINALTAPVATSYIGNGDPGQGSGGSGGGGASYVLPTASTTVKGGVKIDGTTITITNGVISATQTPVSIGINSLLDVDTVTAPPTTGSVLKWNGTSWVPGTDATGGGGGTDADTLNGQAGTYYLNYNNLTNKPNLSTYATQTDISNAISDLVNTAPTTLDTLNELATALGNDANFSTTVATSLSLKAPLDSPTFTGTVSGITASMVGLGNVDNESKATMFASPTFTGTTTLQQSTEVLNTKTGATGVVVHDYSLGAIWYHSSISANFTANFTNVPTTTNRTIVNTMILVQGGTAYIPNAVQIAGSAQTIKWLNGSTPTGNANKVDIVSFTFINVGSTWTVTGSLTTYG